MRIISIARQSLQLKDQLLPKIDKYMRIHLHNLDNKTIDIQEITTNMALLVAFKLLMEIESSSIYKAYKAEFDKLMVGALSLPINVPRTNYHRGFLARKSLLGILRDIIEGRRNSLMKHNDMLDYLLEEEDERYKLNDNEIIDQVIMILYSGFETVSTTSMMAIKYLHDHPSALQEIRESNSLCIVRKLIIGDIRNIKIGHSCQRGFEATKSLSTLSIARKGKGKYEIFMKGKGKEPKENKGKKAEEIDAAEEEDKAVENATGWWDFIRKQLLKIFRDLIEALRHIFKHGYVSDGLRDSHSIVLEAGEIKATKLTSKVVKCNSENSLRKNIDELREMLVAAILWPHKKGSFVNVHWLLDDSAFWSPVEKLRLIRKLNEKIRVQWKFHPHYECDTYMDVELEKLHFVFADSIQDTRSREILEKST
ncbi:hypothetical protein Vadar_027387 [Vaccinium darrowii]|uniref:Uncharacterized protein n=1 Tax=Vaccinium darrowii TaxID=229202 RepID=A0ACB7Y9A6_9ERIC|nr:hypothetical protein Vadar_027387 [Vaccinium darrowii]